MSIYTLTFFGCNPIGSLLAGSCAEGMGVPATLAMMAFVSFIFACWFWFKKPHLRQL